MLHPHRLALALLTGLLTSPLGAQEASPGDRARILADDGAWCWFADPRGVFWPAGSTSYLAGWVSSAGDVTAAQLSGPQETPRVVPLREDLQRDDHDNPAFLGLPDGDLLAFYSGHGGPEMYLRRTVSTGDSWTFGPERSLPLNPPPAEDDRGTTTYCYPNPVRLAEEAGRIYLFWRGVRWKPSMAWSDDEGETWTTGRAVFSEPDAPPSNRPYLKVASDGRRRIHFALTDGHPRNEATNSIWYARYEDGALWRADGSPIARLDQLPVAPSRIDRVYDGSAGGGRAWIWDVAAEAAGHPVIVYAQLPEEHEHHYRYARWDGEAWRDFPICAAGGWFPQTPAGQREPEPHYSGGVVLDPDDPSTVFLARKVQGVFEIERWHTPDGGESWESAPITSGSAAHNVRPFVVRGREPGTAPTVIWMHLGSHYRHYTDFETSLRWNH